jgi:H+/Na+-translocating ferredoxin:NAD+ oxidoreductase subunit G
VSEKLPMAHANGGGATGPAPVQVETSGFRLVGTLAVAGALAGMAIVVAFQWATPRIQAHKAQVLSEAITQVLGGAARYETVFLDGGTFTATPKADTAKLDRVYVGYDTDGRPRGVAVEAAEGGFQDVIDLLFGYDPAKGDVVGMTVLDSKETPGLGDKITRDSTFIGEFGGVGTPLLGVKKDRAKGAHDEVVMITGATISSRAVIKIINDRLEAIKKPVDGYWSTLSVAADHPGAAAPGGGER